MKDDEQGHGFFIIKTDKENNKVTISNENFCKVISTDEESPQMISVQVDEKTELPIIYERKERKEILEHESEPRRRILDVGDLPDWFDIDNYTNTKYLSAENLYLELRIREVYYSMINPIDIRNPQEWHGDSNDIHPQFRYFVTWEDKLNNHNSNKKELLSKVVDLKENLSKNKESDVYKIIEKKFVLFSGLVTTNTNFSGCFSNLPPTSSHIGEPFKIKLLEPDILAVNRFKNWLKSQRKKFILEVKSNKDGVKNNPYYDYSISKNFNVSFQGKLNKINSTKILPYLDLHYWAMINNYHINKKTYANALLPDLEGDTKKQIEDKTYKIAYSIKSLMELLWLQIKSNN